MKAKDWIKLSPVLLKSLLKLPLPQNIYMAKLLRCENPHRHGGRLYINTFFPPYPSEAFGRFMQAVYDRRRVPFSTYFAVTDKCPYKCGHCSYGNHKKGQLSTAEAIRVVEQIKSVGTVTIGFTGGEPLLRGDIAALVRQAGGSVSKVLFTTGYNLDAALAGELKDAGLDAMMIGIESDDEQTHDGTRGAGGSFRQALKAIETSRQAGIYTGISTVATKDKLQNGTIRRLAATAGQWGASEFRILEPVPTGSLSGQTGQLLAAGQSRQLADFHKQWNKAGKGAAVSCFSHLESDEAFGCGAGFHHLFIDALGNVCPCDLTPLSFGNALEESLAAIWGRMEKHFAQPRCGCLMSELAPNLGLEGQTLPLEPQKSGQICEMYKKTSPLPQAFKRL